MLNCVFLVCNAQNFTFLSVESHLPLLFPFVSPIKVLLELFTVPLVADFPIYQAIVANSLTVDRIHSGMSFM